MADISPDLPAGLVVDHIPGFITGPGQSDWLFQGVGIFVVLLILVIGHFYLHLHSLPDRLAHRANSTQLQVVGILTLLALFTHNNLFWVAALLLVTIQLPDIVTPLTSIARSLEAGRRDRQPDLAGPAEKEH
ncbi:hypothetical protein [Pseudoruegeria sp. SK021]|uniref:hypothetical protein n=1 Tax=Pseudoruegeria sp. SK021 TaxID=1933035 RepID=UPI000A24B512|nr:hypothetical protein [Pseudoruegeria sp. SK021]OSP56691.1 hypothetical protein BV911_01685 [Pseudoruegeria sp. SK021]